MAIIFRTFFFFTIIGLFLLMIYSYFVSSISRSRDLYEEHLAKLKELLSPLKDSLIPYDIHEVKILNWRPVPQKTKGAVHRGFISTIFQEHLFAYAHTTERGVDTLVVSSAAEDYSFFTEEGITKVFLSNDQLGTISADYQFMVMDGAKVLSIIEEHDNNMTINDGKGEEQIKLYFGDQKFNMSDRLFKMINDHKKLKDPTLVAFILFLMITKNKND